MNNESDSCKFRRDAHHAADSPPPLRHPAPRIRHVLGLAILVAVVGYFGVWRGWGLAVEQWGPFWGGVVGIAALAGLVVIAAAGYIVIRTIPIMEDARSTDREEPRDR